MSEQTRPQTEERTGPRKLSAGHKHLLSLIRKGAAPDGWAPVSAQVALFFTDHNIRGGIVPPELCQFEPIGEEGRGRARLTNEGNAVLDAMVWL